MMVFAAIASAMATLAIAIYGLALVVGGPRLANRLVRDVARASWRAAVLAVRWTVRASWRLARATVRFAILALRAWGRTTLREVFRLWRRWPRETEVASGIFMLLIFQDTLHHFLSNVR